MRPLALLTVISLCAGPHAAQGGELVIGHVHLHLGMPKEEVLPALSKEFDPKLVSESEGEYLLWTRDPVSHVPMSAGRVAFKAGRLYRAAKTWAEDPHGGMATADGLFAVLAEAAVANAPASQVSIELKLYGPNVTITQKDPSGINALLYASLALASGRAKAMLAGAVDEWNAFYALGFDRVGALRGDRRASGIVQGEGAFAVLLEDEQH